MIGVVNRENLYILGPEHDPKLTFEEVCFINKWYLLRIHCLTHVLVFTLSKSKIKKILNSEEKSIRKVPNQMANSRALTHQTKDNNCHIPDFIQAFSYLENNGLNLLL